MRVGLIGENSIEYINVLLDIWNNGDCAVLIDWRIPPQTALEMMREASVQRCYIEKRMLEKADNFNVSGIEFVVFERKSASAELVSQNVYDRFIKNYTSSEAVVTYSSGTTGKAKGIILSHYAINTNADAIIDYMKPTENDCIYVAKTLSHSSTLTGELLVALKTHLKLVMAPAIVPPRITLTNVSRFGVTILCLNPTLLSMYAEEYSRNRYDITPLRVMYVSGSILSDRVYKIARETFVGVPIYNVYGLSEAGPRVTAQRGGCCQSNSVGRPIKGVEIAIVDDDGNEVSRGERGIVYVNTICQSDGYITGSEKLTSLYRGWLNTGDIGFIDEYDELHVVDRVDDVIIIDSHKIYPSDVERQVLKNQDVNECCITKISLNDNMEYIGCLYTGKQDTQKEIISKLKKKLLPYEIPQFFIHTEFLPKTLNGKVNRNESSEIIMKHLL